MCSNSNSCLLLCLANTRLFIDSCRLQTSQGTGSSIHSFSCGRKMSPLLTTGIHEATAVSSPSCKCFPNNWPTQLAYRAAEFLCFYNANSEGDTLIFFSFLTFKWDISCTHWWGYHLTFSTENTC